MCKQLHFSESVAEIESLPDIGRRPVGLRRSPAAIRRSPALGNIVSEIEIGDLKEKSRFSSI